MYSISNFTYLISFIFQKNFWVNEVARLNSLHKVTQLMVVEIKFEPNLI